MSSPPHPAPAPPPHPVTPLYSVTSSHSADDHAHSITYTHRTPTYPIYLDNNATTCIAPEVAQVMLPYMFTYWGNPSSSHIYGSQAKTAMITARQHVATCIGAQPSEIIFTSGATESIMYAFTGLTQTLLRQRQHVDSAYVHRNHIITVATEHVAVLEVCRHLHSQYGIDITYLSVDQHGSINIDELTKAITDKTFLVSLMLANNESGTLHPVSEISRLVKRIDPAIIVHTDASQAMGKIEVNVETLGVDLLTIAGHKLYAPKGIGCLYVRSSLPLPLTNLMHGGGQESGHRAGTENVILAAALGEACRLVTQNGQTGFKHMHDMRIRLEEQIQQQLCAQTASSASPITHDILNTRLRVHGHPTACLPNTLSLAIHGVNATRLLSDISSHVAASAGAACHSVATHLSHVLEAMHIDPVWGRGTVRLTTGRYTTSEQVDEAAERIAKAILSQWLSSSIKS